MIKTPTIPPGFTKSPPLDVPLGEVYVKREALDALLVSSVSLDDVLKWHGTGYGGDPDHEDDWDNYEAAAAGGPNISIHDLDEEEVAQLRVVTPPDRAVTIVSLHTEAD